MNKPKEELDKTELGHDPQPAFAELTIFHLSTIIYSIMAAIGILIAVYGHGNLLSAVTIPEDEGVLLKLLAIAGLSTGVLLIAGFLFEEWFPSYRAIRDSVTTILGPTSVPMALYLALISAVGEELLFRGGILPYAGLIVTSILFGLLHLGPDGRISAWSLWAVLAGLLLGWTYEATGSLLPPILTHFLINAISILRLQRIFRAKMRLLESNPAVALKESGEPK